MKSLSGSKLGRLFCYLELPFLRFPKCGFSQNGTKMEHFFALKIKQRVSLAITKQSARQDVISDAFD